MTTRRSSETIPLSDDEDEDDIIIHSDHHDHIRATTADHDILTEEAEREDLLTIRPTSLFGRRRNSVLIGPSDRSRRNSMVGDEEGPGEGDDVGDSLLGEKGATRGRKVRGFWYRVFMRTCATGVCLVVLLVVAVVILFAAVELPNKIPTSDKTEIVTVGTPTNANSTTTTSAVEEQNEMRRVTNGTHEFVPTVLIISLDGFRADFLTPTLTPHLYNLSHSLTPQYFSSDSSSPIASDTDEGGEVVNASGIDFASSKVGIPIGAVNPPYLLPSFPSVTFPNHYTLVTGLYPSSHGIIGNEFHDPVSNSSFIYTDPTHSHASHWWEGVGGMKGHVEPVWCTCARQGIRSAVHMWPGSEAVINGCAPDYLDPYRAGVGVEDKVERVLGWLDMEDEVRPGFMGVYVPDVDSAGHVYGPESVEVAEALETVDRMVGTLVAGILKRNLSGIVDLVVVSDHGMATSSASRVVFLDDLINVHDIEHIDGWPLFGLWPKSNISVTEMYANISAQHTPTSPWDVYLRDTIPARYHFSRHDNPRIAPLWLIPRPGWAITTHDRFDPEIEDYAPRGIHGYDNASPLMRALFVGVGPGFVEWTGDKKAGPIANVEVYGIVTRLLGITPNSNNGTLNGKLKPAGPSSQNYTYVRLAAECALASLRIEDEGLEQEEEALLKQLEEDLLVGVPTQEEEMRMEVEEEELGWLEWMRVEAEEAREWVKAEAEEMMRKAKGGVKGGG